VLYNFFSAEALKVPSLVHYSLLILSAAVYAAKNMNIITLKDDYLSFTLHNYEI